MWSGRRAGVEADGDAGPIWAARARSGLRGPELGCTGREHLRLYGCQLRCGLLVNDDDKYFRCGGVVAGWQPACSPACPAAICGLVQLGVGGLGVRSLGRKSCSAQAVLATAAPSGVVPLHGGVAVKQRCPPSSRCRLRVKTIIRRPGLAMAALRRRFFVESIALETIAVLQGALWCRGGRCHCSGIGPLGRCVRLSPSPSWPLLRTSQALPLACLLSLAFKGGVFSGAISLDGVASLELVGVGRDAVLLPMLGMACSCCWRCVSGG